MTGGDDQSFLPGLVPERKRRRPAEPSLDRFFLALKPDPMAAGEACEAALRLKREYGLAGTPLKPQNFHISLPLVWDGDDAPADLAETVSAQVQAVRMPAFEIVLDMAMCFRQSKRYVLVLGTTRSVAHIYGLNRQLVLATRRGTGKASFMPHMTLLYADKPVEKQPVEPIRWMAREFVLVHSFVGLGRHETVAHWPLR